ncbi:endo-1,4-beta-xylanase [Actinomycetes bacterium KLBMP 9797]
MSMRTRLAVFGCLAALAAGAGVGVATPASAAASPPLRALPGAQRVYIGSAATVDELALGPRFRSTLGREFNMLTPGNDLKWETTEPARGVFDYQPKAAYYALADAYRSCRR